MLAPYNHLWHIFTCGHIPCLEGDAARRAFDALDKVAAHLRSNRLLVKPGPSAVCMMPDARYALPYEEATVLSQADPHWIAAESAVPGISPWAANFLPCRGADAPSETGKGEMDSHPCGHFHDYSPRRFRYV